MSEKQPDHAGAALTMEQRRALLWKKIRDAGLEAPIPSATVSTEPPTPELSAAQQRMWFLQTRDPHDTTLNVCVAYRLIGELDPERLRAAFAAVLARHEVLRITVQADATGIPRPVLHNSTDPVWQQHDLTEVPHANRERRMEVLARREFARPFDLAVDRPLRLTLIQMSSAEWILVFVAHHICWDDESWRVLFAELAAAYHGTGDRSVLRRPADITRTQDNTAALAYWRTQLTPAPELLELPGEHNTAKSDSTESDHCTLALPNDLVAQVKSLASEHGATPFMVLLAAFETLISRYTGSSDFLTAVPVVERSAGEQHLIGYFGNTVLLRARVDLAARFDTHLRAVIDRCTAGFAHAGVGIDEVVRELGLPQAGGTEQLVRLGFAARSGVDGLSLPGVTAHRLELGNTHAQLPLGFMVVSEAGETWVEAEYHVEVFERSLVEQLLRHYRTVLGDAVRRPECRIGELELLDAAERSAIIAAASGLVHPTPATTLVALWQDRVAEDPDRLAIATDDAELTYRTVNSRANRLAREFIARGIRPEDIVALELGNSVEFVVAALAVLKSGAGYLPVDPSYPQDRREYLVRDARPVLRVDRPMLDVLEVSAAEQPDTNPDDRDRRAPLRPEHPAYVIYTSGSTGEPKGVCVAHDTIAEHLIGLAAQHGLSASERMLQVASVSFDASLTEVFLTLTAGACLVIPKPDGLQDIAYLAELMTRRQVTVMHMVPSLLSVLLRLPDVSAWRMLRHVPVGGEALPGEVADTFAGVFDATLSNNYGPTEAVVTATHYRVDGPQGNRTVPIGAPNRNVGVYLLDPGLAPVPDAVIGEIYIGGAQLARGYLGRPGLTAQRFVADPFTPGGRLYRTGDLATRNRAGELEFVGRIDEQVKIRGFRIELGEVEAAVAAHPMVGQCVVIACDDPSVGKLLAAYLVPATETDPSAVDFAQIQQHAAGRLPEYMVPQAFALLTAIPLTAHGKLDRRALPAPTRIAVQQFREPETPTESRVAAIFRQLFDRDRIGIDDSFFQLGGHSLSAVELVARLKSTFGVDIGVRTVFDTPTPAGLAAAIDSGVSVSNRPARPELPAGPRPDPLPLSFFQSSMWFRRRIEGVGEVGNIPVAVQLDGPFDPAALSAALGDVLNRHEALRTVIVDPDGVPGQQILSAVQPAVQIVEVDDALLRSELARMANRPFERLDELLLRAAILVLGPDRHVLSLVLHHVIADHWSIRTLVTDLGTAYRARAAGIAPHWPTPERQFADFAMWQHEIFDRVTAADAHPYAAVRLDYWRRTLDGMPTQLHVAPDRPRPAVLGKNGVTASFQVSPQLRGTLKTLADAVGATEFMVCHAAAAVLLSKLGAGTDIPIGTPVAGRSDPVTENLVGPLVNLVVLRTDLDATSTLRTVLARARDAALGAFENQELPFERLVEALAPPRARNRHPLFQVMVHFREQNWDAVSFDIPGRETTAMTVLPFEFDTALMDLSLNFFPSGDGGFDASVVANADLYDPATAELFAGRLLRVLQAFAEDSETTLADLQIVPDDEAHLLRSWEHGVARQEPSTSVSENSTPSSRRAFGRDPGEDQRNTRPESAPERPLARVHDIPELADMSSRPESIAGAGSGPRPRAHRDDGESSHEYVRGGDGVGSFQARSQGSSEAVALRCGDRELSYRQVLDEFANAATAEAPEQVELPDAVDSGSLGRWVSVLGLGCTRPELRYRFSGSTVTAYELAMAAAARNSAPWESAQPDVRLLAEAVDPVATAVEILAALTGGSTLVLAERTQASDPTALGGLIGEHRPDQVHADPAVLLALPHAGFSVLPSVRSWTVTAESAPAELIATVATLSAGSELYFRYYLEGIAGIALSGTAEGARPMPGVRATVLDETGRATPIGIPGELFLATAETELLSTGRTCRWIPGNSTARRGGEDGNSRGVLDFSTAAQVAEIARAPKTADSAPVTETERVLIGILAELLEITEVDPEDGFFALGGDSVISIQWAARANTAGLPLTPQLVFEHPTIAELAAAVDAAVPEADQEPPVADRRLEPMSASGLSAELLADLTAAWQEQQS